MALPIRNNQEIRGLRRFARPDSRAFRAYYAQQRRKDRKKSGESS